MKTKGKNFNYYLSYMFAYPMWLMTSKDNRKSKIEFESGLIEHICEYDYENPKTDRHGYGAFYPCKHLGCNFVSLNKK